MNCYAKLALLFYYFFIYAIRKEVSKKIELPAVFIDRLKLNYACALYNNMTWRRPYELGDDTGKICLKLHEFSWIYDRNNGGT